MFDQALTTACRAFLARERAAGRVTGFSREADGVFIYTDSSQWCDDHGAGTFRGDTEAAAMRRFKAQVQRAANPSPWPDCQVCQGKGFYTATVQAYAAPHRFECPCPKRPKEAAQ